MKPFSKCVCECSNQIYSPSLAFPLLPPAFAQQLCSTIIILVMCTLEAHCLFIFLISLPFLLTLPAGLLLLLLIHCAVYDMIFFLLSLPPCEYPTWEVPTLVIHSEGFAHITIKKNKGRVPAYFIFCYVELPHDN